jgi:uncharacterized repeat protein (TIGR01451 family)
MGDTNNAVFTCDSLTAEVVSGPVVITLDDRTTVEVPTGTTVAITAATGGGWDVTNTAGVDDPIITPPPDLEVTLVANPPGVVPVQTASALAYTATVRNLGTKAGFSGVVLTVRLPGGVNFESVTPNLGICSAQGRNVTCQVGDLAVAPGAGSEFTASIVIGTKGGNSLTTEASATANETDPNPANDRASATVSVCRRNCP